MAWSVVREQLGRRRVVWPIGLLLWASVAGRFLVAAESTAPLPLGLELSARVDALLAERLASEAVQAAAPADDAELLRRLHIDLTGVIPSVWEVQDYLDDPQPDKFARRVERLLLSPAHATHLANVWRDMMLPRKFEPEQVRGLIGVQNWLREQFIANRRYDRVVADLLVSTGAGESGPALFYTALGVKPEELAATTARLFLGLRLDCAQCHDHPFDRWKQQDFWGYAAFFARLQPPEGNRLMRLVDLDQGEVRLPNSDTVVPPRYLAGKPVAADEIGTRRQQLAIWVVSRDNPYLAPATVNLVWAQLFGRGLVEPLDDFSDHNPASHPQLLDELAEAFVQSGYDLRQLYRTLVHTQAYQRGSRPAGEGEPRPELFAAMSVKVLTPEELYDSLNAVALQPTADGIERLADPRRQAFLLKMQTQTRSATNFEMGVAQALRLMNGPEMGEVVETARSQLLRALGAPFLSDEQRVEIAFLATLGRRPSAAEGERCQAYVKAANDNQRDRLGDLVWALLNSAEFTLNH